MGDLESQEVDAPKRVLCYKPMVFLGVISPHHRDEVYTLPTTISVINTGRNIPFPPSILVMIDVVPLVCFLVGNNVVNFLFSCCTLVSSRSTTDRTLPNT